MFECEVENLSLLVPEPLKALKLVESCELVTKLNVMQICKFDLQCGFHILRHDPARIRPKTKPGKRNSNGCVWFSEFHLKRFLDRESRLAGQFTVSGLTNEQHAFFGVCVLRCLSAPFCFRSDGSAIQIVCGSFYGA